MRSPSSKPAIDRDVSTATSNSASVRTRPTPVLAQDGLGGGDPEHGRQERDSGRQREPGRAGRLGEPEQRPRPGVPPVDHGDERERHEAGEDDQRGFRGEEVERHQ